MINKCIKLLEEKVKELSIELDLEYDKEDNNDDEYQTHSATDIIYGQISALNYTIIIMRPK